MSSANLYHYWWGFFHRLSLIIENRANYDHLVNLGLNLLDCDHCRTDALKFYQKLDSSLTPFEKMHHLHNHVNEVTHKPLHTLEQNYRLYQDTIGLDDQITWSLFFGKYFELIFELTYHLTPSQLSTFREFTSYLTETIPITKSGALNPILAKTTGEFNRTELFKETYRYYINLIQKTPQINISPMKYEQIYKLVTQTTQRAMTNNRTGGCKKCAERKRQKELHYQQKMMRLKESQNKPQNISPFLGQRDLLAKSKTTISQPKPQTKLPHRVIRQVPTPIPIPVPTPTKTQLSPTKTQLPPTKTQLPPTKTQLPPTKTQVSSNRVQVSARKPEKSRNKQLIYRSKNISKLQSNAQLKPKTMLNLKYTKSLPTIHQTPAKTEPRVIRVSHRDQNIPKINQHIRTIRS